MTMDALTKWRGMFNARAVIDSLSGLVLHQLGGNVLGASGLATGINVITQVAPQYTSGNSALRYYCGGEKADGTYTGRIGGVSGLSATNHLFGPQVIEDVRRMARASVAANGALVDPIQPVNVNGKMLYVMLISLKQGKNLRGNTTWRSGHYYADIRGLENSIFSGQLGVWDNVMIIETDLVHQRVGDTDYHKGTGWFDATGAAGTTTVGLPNGVNASRALFLGANAVAWAWGKAPEYAEFYADHAKTKWAARVTSIYGVMKVCKYSTATTPLLTSDSEKGCIVVDTSTSVTTRE